MKPGIELEPAYKLMADYKAHEDNCERFNMSYDAEYWHVKLCGAQNTLKALTGEWPGALHKDDGIMIVHGTYEQTFNLQPAEPTRKGRPGIAYSKREAEKYYTMKVNEHRACAAWAAQFDQPHINQLGDR